MAEVSRTGAPEDQQGDRQVLQPPPRRILVGAVVASTPTDGNNIRFGFNQPHEQVRVKPRAVNRPACSPQKLARQHRIKHSL